MKPIESVCCIILNYNSSKEVIELYNQLNEFNNGVSIIIVDNNSEQEEKELLLKSIDSNFLIFNKFNIGYAGGNNIGIKKAIKEDAKYVWILNPDIQITKNTLPILLKTIESNINIAAIGPRICYRNMPSKIYSDGGIILQEKGFFTTHKNYNKESSSVHSLTKENEVDYVNGSAMLISVDAYRKIGFLKEGFFLYFEETEWCLRALKFKYKLVVNTEAIAYHISSKKGELYHFYMTRNRIWLAKSQNKYVFITLKEVTKTVVLQLLRELKKGKISQNTKSRIKGLIAGVFGNVKK